MFEELRLAVEDFARIMLPLSEADLARAWAWKDHDEDGLRFAFFVTIQELRELAVQLGATRRAPTQAQRILSQYHKQYMDLQAAVFGISKEDSGRAPADGEWPVRQAYAHILGAEIGFSCVVRFALEGHRAGRWTPERMSEEDETRISGISEAEYNGLMQRPLSELLSYHQGFHDQVLDDFSRITDAELELPSAFWEETRFPLRHRLHRYEAHFIQHTVQIDKALAAIGQAPSEAKRLIRYLFAALAEVRASMIGENNSQEACHERANIINSRIAEVKSVLEV